MQKYLTEYIQNTILFFVITIIWNLLEGIPLNWVFMVGQSLLFGVILTFITVWYSRRKKKKESEVTNSNKNE